MNVHRPHGGRIVISVAESFAIGGVASIISVSATAPLDRVRILLQCNHEINRTRLAADILHAGTDGKRQRQFKGIFDVYRKTLRSDGIVGLHRGFMVSCMGVVVYRGAYFGLYDTLRPMFLNYEGSTLILTGFLLGYVTTIVAEIISYPLDTIRRRMMMRSCEEVKYKGWVECVRYAYRNEGLLSLYGGVSINIMKGFASLPILIFYEGFKTLFTRYRLEND
uniref:ADP/ATP translocase n=1 Tax=Magallana gigas TaxID=29159 RepID=A0A8W8P3Y6_MAGGI